MLWLLLGCGSPSPEAACDAAIQTSLAEMPPERLLATCGPLVEEPACAAAFQGSAAKTAQEGLSRLGACMDALCAGGACGAAPLTTAGVRGPFRESLRDALAARGLPPSRAYAIAESACTLALPTTRIPLHLEARGDALVVTVGAGAEARTVSLSMAAERDARGLPTMDVGPLVDVIASIEPDPALVDLELYDRPPASVDVAFASTLGRRGYACVACFLGGCAR
ncbi:MAG: hypothetical protein H6737_11705 [Alphaproteobacteria bacterium]|nr:hypothetical protein [Alphaproteobacteria bacterium]